MSKRDKLNLLTILDAIEKISKFTSEYKNADDFYENQRDFDATMMNFIIIGEMVSRLSDVFINKNNHIDWFKIKGFRNIAAHNYFGIDAEEVWQLIRNSLPQLEVDLHEILKTM